MTPPLTGFFMRAAGLGQVHKEIEKQKREGGMVGYNGSRNRKPSVGHVGQFSRTRAPSWPVRETQKLTIGSPSSSREIVRGRDGPTPFPKVHRDDVSLEALDDHNLDWSYDPNEKGYIIIEKHLTRQELKELLQHTAWLRERKERDLALRKSEMEAERETNLRGSKESEMEAERETNLRGSKERSDARRDSERGRGRHAERASVRDDRSIVGGHTRVSQPGIHIHVDQIQNNQPPVPRKASMGSPTTELPSPPHPRFQRSRAPSTHSRLTRPFDPHDFTPIEQPRQISPQAHGLRSQSRAPRVPSELGVTHHAQEPYNPRARPPTVRQDPRPFAEAPNIRPAGRRLSHLRPPSEDAQFASPPHRRDSYDPRPRPPSVQENSRSFAGAPGIRLASRRLSHVRPPSEHIQFAPPSRTESLIEARSELPRQAAANARQFPLQHARGSIPPRRERSPSFVGRRSESRRGDSRAPGPRVEGRDGMGRRNSVRGYRPNY